MALALVAASGCATKGFVRTEVAGAKTYSDARLGETRTELKGDVEQVRTRADQAYDKATLAEKLASGQYDYNEVSSHQVQFKFDDYRLNTESQSMLDNMATELASHPGYVLEIRGFADARGTDRYNYRLGRERADEVMRYLMSRHGVPTTRMAIVSFGEESPVADNTSRDGRAQNRRVQVRLLEMKGAGETPVSMNP
jgi:outer membrane protein OmpA-like peptidoglycan-associated protein